MMRSKMDVIGEFFKDHIDATCIDSTYNTNCAFMTCTIDPKQYPTIEATWKALRAGVDKMRKRLSRRGMKHYVKVIESHKSGYPHLHILLLFESKHRLHWKESKVKGKPGAYRFDYELTQSIKEGWSLGWVDVQGVISAEGAIGYVTKDMSKSTWKNNREEQSVLTLAWQWYQGMRFMSYTGKADDPDSIRGYLSLASISEHKAKPPFDEQMILDDHEVRVEMEAAGFQYRGCYPTAELESMGWVFGQAGPGPPQVPEHALDLLKSSVFYREERKGRHQDDWNAMINSFILQSPEFWENKKLVGWRLRRISSSSTLV